MRHTASYIMESRTLADSNSVPTWTWLPLWATNANHRGSALLIYPLAMIFGDGKQAWCASGHKPDIRTIRDTGYLQTIRNFRRIQWLIMLLTGSSPSVDESFRLLATDGFGFLVERLAEGATSLRMSDLGTNRRHRNRLIFASTS